MELRDKNGLTEKEFLANYRPKDYPRPSLTADIVIFQKIENKLYVLLVERGGHPFLGKWAFPGGFANPGETIEESALRELEEETHLKNLPLEEVGVFSKPGRDPRMWVVSTAFVSFLDEEQKPMAGDDAKSCSFFEVQVVENEKEIEFQLTNGTIKLTAKLSKEVKKGIKKNFFAYSVLQSDLAFDHALILAKAYEKIA